MPFRRETSARIHHILASLCVVSSIHKLFCLTFSIQPQSFISDQLIRSKTIVQLYHLYVVRCYFSFFINQIKSITSMIIVALTSGVSRPLSIMNFECNVSFLRYENLKKNYASITKQTKQLTKII